MTDTLQMQLALNATPQTLYNALTDSGRLTTWFAEYADVSLPDNRYDFWGRFTPFTPDREAGRHPLLDTATDSHLKYSWRIVEQDTTVTISLLPQDAQTLMVVRHEGMTAAHNIANFCEDFWFMSFENLRRYLDGKPIMHVDYTPTGPMKGEARHVVEIDADAATVFDALIRPEQLNRWITNNASVEAQVGGDYNSSSFMSLKIIELVPNEKLAVSVAPNDYWHTETIQTWTLEESNGKTRMTFVHSGFGPEQDAAPFYAGWRVFLSFLRSLSEYGPTWHPAIKRLEPGMEFVYPASIVSRQDELVDV